MFRIVVVQVKLCTPFLLDILEPNVIYLVKDLLYVQCVYCLEILFMAMGNKNLSATCCGLITSPAHNALG